MKTTQRLVQLRKDLSGFPIRELRRDLSEQNPGFMENPHYFSQLVTPPGSKFFPPCGKMLQLRFPIGKKLPETHNKHGRV
jgi:hypothetical protein